jgi:methylmalonyl-CoA mutase
MPTRGITFSFSNPENSFTEVQSDILRWCLQENVPGEYVHRWFISFQRGEDPSRMFAGEGGPERTNKRFHYVSAELPAKRLSTAFEV